MKNRIGHPLPEKTELCSGIYSAHWGLTDLYPEAEAKLRELINSGEDFCAEWGCKKEIRYADVTRAYGKLEVGATCVMDDLDDDALISDALWERVHSEGEDLTEDFWQDVYEAATDAGIYNMTHDSVELPLTASYEDIIAAIESCESSAEECNSSMFKSLCDIVEYYYGFNAYHIKEEE